MTTIPFLILAARKQMSLCKRLAKYCKELDGTEIRVIAGGEETTFPYPHCNNAAFHRASMEMKGSPFGWLEPDSIPLVKGWAQKLTEEYYRLGKEFMLSADSNPPHDLVGGIGIYGANTHWLIPEKFPVGAWDGWMHKHLNPLIGRTSLIQHSYGRYDANGDATPYRFPEDSGILRKGAVIFHRDKFQGLIPQSVEVENVFVHSGCLGDCIAALASMKQLGGGKLIMTQRGNARILRGERYEMLKPLLEAQPYISSVDWQEEPQDFTHDFTDFRKIYTRSQSLADTQAKWIGIDSLDTTPWLTATPSPESKGRVIIARSHRYRNNSFPWVNVLKKYRKEALFVGTKEEHSDLEQFSRQKIEYRKTDNLLEVAELIAGSKLFVGNQSSPCWIAMGLGHPLIQETSAKGADSIIRRQNATFYQSGSLKIP